MILTQFDKKSYYLHGIQIFKISVIITGYVIVKIDFESRTPIVNDNNI